MFPIDYAFYRGFVAGLFVCWTVSYWTGHGFSEHIDKAGTDIDKAGTDGTV